MDEIKVYVINKGRKSLYLKFTDPATGKVEERSAKTSNSREAAKAAGVWEDELRDGRYQKTSKMTWEAFREYVVNHYLPGLDGQSPTAYLSTLNVFQRVANPQRLSDVTTPRITNFVTELRVQNRSDATIARHLRTLKAIFNWAKGENLLKVVPSFKMPKRAKNSKIMRGRAPTTEEFERMLAAVPKIVEYAAADSWKFYLRGLWMSGLRLAESLTLRWESAPDCIVVDFSGKRPMLRIPASAEKGKEDRVLPMTPEFAELLQTVPQRQRRGTVFKLRSVDGHPLEMTKDIVGKTVSKIGEAAGVVVDEWIEDGELCRKYASAHDLRRAFGTRWAVRVMPTVLQQMMRHKSIETTTKYYVCHNAQDMADTIWNSLVDTLVDTSLSSKTADSENPCNSSTGERT